MKCVNSHSGFAMIRAP